ncbi:MAG: ABC transporter permease [Oscillospiraceae bacterium]
MNIVQKLTWRQMKLNRRRTLVTIIGVVISVAMITAVMTLGFSFQDMFKRSVIAEDGEWHVVYRGLDEKQVQQVWEDPESKKVLLSRDVGYSLLPGGQNGYKPYLFLKEYNRQALEEFPITLTKGRLPLNSSEVLIPEHVASNGGVQYQLEIPSPWRWASGTLQELRRRPWGRITPSFPERRGTPKRSSLTLPIPAP